MEYRTLKDGKQVSIIGLGGAWQASVAEIARAAAFALEQGVNYFDLAGAEDKLFEAYGQAMSGSRKQLFYQIHFGAYYPEGKYGWTLELEAVKRSVDMQLKKLKTDYIDFGFIHCLDEDQDWAAYQKNGVLDYILELKKAGTVRGIGLSSHTPSVVNKILDTGLVDQLMFSINPGYDYQHGEYSRGEVNERLDLYQRCEREQIGISVMKPFGGGVLLKGATSPFGKALTPVQCIQYALDKPAVKTVLAGVGSPRELTEALHYLEASEEERDYSILGSFTPADARGRCVYCNHCQPCPAGLEIALINKYYDLAKAGDGLARDHYMHLGKHAGDCIGCGHCDKRCPFGTPQSKRMEEIAGYFGK